MTRLLPRQKDYDLEFPLVGGGTWRLSEQTPSAFTLLVVFRHRHCSYCKRQIGELNELSPRFEALGVEPVAVSADTSEKTQDFVEEVGVQRLAVGHSLPRAAGARLGLYVSSARKETEPDWFFEPGLFAFTPDGALYYAAVQNMPFGRPHWSDMLEWLPKALENAVPARGELSAGENGSFASS